MSNKIIIGKKATNVKQIFKKLVLSFFLPAMRLHVTGFWGMAFFWKTVFSPFFPFDIMKWCLHITCIIEGLVLE